MHPTAVAQQAAGGDCAYWVPDPVANVVHELVHNNLVEVVPVDTFPR